MKPQVRALLALVPSTDEYDKVFHLPDVPLFELELVATNTKNGAMIFRGNHSLIFKFDEHTVSFKSEWRYDPL
jgi:hypothetical protein